MPWRFSVRPPSSAASPAAFGRVGRAGDRLEFVEAAACPEGDAGEWLLGKVHGESGFGLQPLGEAAQEHPGLVEIVPVIGPLVAGVVAIGVGLSVSTHLAVVAGLLVLGVRLLEDYLIIPRVLGHSVGLSPLVVLVSVTLVGVVFGGFAVILAVPLASIIVTLFDIVVRDKDPAEEEVPSVIFPAQDSE